MSDAPVRAGALRDEVALLRRSIDDARAEHARGELDDAGLAEIERRDGARLDAALARLGNPGDTGDPGAEAPEAPRASGTGDERDVPDVAPAVPVRRRRASRRLLAAAACAFAAAAAVVAVAVVQPFASPVVHPLARSARVPILLTAAEVELAHGRTLRALTLYDAVLKLDPSNPEALAESGWLRYEHALGTHDAAQVALGVAALHRAVVVAPAEAAGHLYYGVVLWQHDHDRAAALAQLAAAAALPESPIERSLTAAFTDLVRGR